MTNIASHTNARKRMIGDFIYGVWGERRKMFLYGFFRVSKDEAKSAIIYFKIINPVSNYKWIFKCKWPIQPHFNNIQTSSKLQKAFFLQMNIKKNKEIGKKRDRERKRFGKHQYFPLNFSKRRICTQFVLKIQGHN